VDRAAPSQARTIIENPNADSHLNHAHFIFFARHMCAVAQRERNFLHNLSAGIHCVNLTEQLLSFGYQHR
jgi:hypothetical protein